MLSISLPHMILTVPLEGFCTMLLANCSPTTNLSSKFISAHPTVSLKDSFPESPYWVRRGCLLQLPSSWLRASHSGSFSWPEACWLAGLAGRNSCLVAFQAATLILLSMHTVGNGTKLQRRNHRRDEYGFINSSLQLAQHAGILALSPACGPSGITKA